MLRCLKVCKGQTGLGADTFVDRRIMKCDLWIAALLFTSYLKGLCQHGSTSRTLQEWVLDSWTDTSHTPWHGTTCCDSDLEGFGSHTNLQWPQTENHLVPFEFKVAADLSSSVLVKMSPISLVSSQNESSSSCGWQQRCFESRPGKVRGRNMQQGSEKDKKNLAF